MSPEDLEYVTRTVMSEESDPWGRLGVAHAINNRFKSGKYKSLKDVVLAKGQFEPWANAGSGHHNDPFRHDERGHEFQQVAKLVEGVISGAEPDITHGATHFYAPEAQAKLGRKPPKWAQTFEAKADLGKTKFFAEPKQEYVAPSWLGEPPDESKGYQAPKWLGEAPDEIGGLPQEGPREAPKAPADWGHGKAFLHGAALGFLPEIEARVETGKLSGPEVQAREAELRAAHDQYSRANPKLGPLVEMGGSLASTAVPMGLAGRAIGVGARLLPKAGPVVDFLAGKAGGNVLTRGASMGAQGGIQGAAQGAITTKLNPEEQGVEGSTKHGAIGGAIANVLLGPTISKIAAPFEESINPKLADLARKLNDKYGLGLRKSQLGGKGSELERLDLTHVSQGMHEAQVEKFNKVLADRVGTVDFTPQAIKAAKDQTGQLLDHIASQTNMSVAPGFRRTLNQLARDAHATMTDPQDLLKALRTIQLVANETASGQISGKRFRDLTYSGGLLANDLINSKVPKLQQIGKTLRKEMFDQFNVTNPNLAPVYNKARQNYRELLVLEPHADASGVIDPSKLLATAKRKGVTGDLRDLAEGGKFMPKVSAGQARSSHPKGHQWNPLELGAAGYIGYDLSGAFPSIAEHLTNPYYAVPAGIAAGLRYGGNALQGAVVRSPRANAFMLDGWGPGAGTIGRQGASALGGSVGAQTGTRKKK
jgi:N-acetylmuramoyl-L-alanine amidase